MIFCVKPKFQYLTCKNYLKFQVFNDKTSQTPGFLRIQGFLATLCLLKSKEQNYIK